MAKKLSDTNKTKFYDFVVQFEKEISHNFLHYNLKNDRVVSFCNENKILIGPYNKRNKESTHQYRHFILWDDTKPDKYKNIKGNDSAHNLLRHLRNSMAHGNISMENRQRFRMFDYNGNGKETMTGQISSILFYGIIERIIQTYNKD